MQTLKLNPTLKQDQAFDYLFDTKTNYVFFGGGAGGGKSWLGCEWLLTRCIQYPDTRWFVARNELKRIMTTTYVTWTKVCKHHNIPRDMWDLNRQYNYIEFENGSRIDLLDVKEIPSDPLYERFGSLEYTGGWFEEAGEIAFGAFDVLKGRLGRQKNKDYALLPKMLITANPKKNWVYTTAYKPWREGKLESNYAFVQSLWDDNPHTADDYKKQLDEIKDPVMKARLRDGIWEYDDDPSALIEYDAIVDLFTNKTTFSEDVPQQVPISQLRTLAKNNHEKYMTIDVARFGQDKAVIMIWQGYQVIHIHVEQSCGLDRLQEIARDLANRHGVPRSHTVADEDGVGGGFVDHFKCKGFVANHSVVQPEIAKTDPTKKLNYSNLKTQCAFMLADKVNRREMGIDETRWQEDIIQELEQLKRDKVDKDTKLYIVPKDVIKENIGRSPDFLDSMIMRMWFDLHTQITEKTHSFAIRRVNQNRQTIKERTFE